MAGRHINLGKLTFWVPDAIGELWYCNRGSERAYTDQAIEVFSVLRFKFGLTLRERVMRSQVLTGWDFTWKSQAALPFVGD
jgi:hypothetical protein